MTSEITIWKNNRQLLVVTHSLTSYTLGWSRTPTETSKKISKRFKEIITVLQKFSSVPNNRAGGSFTIDMYVRLLDPVFELLGHFCVLIRFFDIVSR